MIERRSAPQKQSSRRSSTKKKSRRRGRGGQNNKNSVNPLGVLGGLAGSYLGGPAGGALGMQAGKLISQITGYGDYKVSQNTVSNGNSIPTFRQGGDGMRVAHREFLSDVTGSVAFTLNSYAIQPGLNVTFPWLSAIAVQFEEYRIDGLMDCVLNTDRLLDLPSLPPHPRWVLSSWQLTTMFSTPLLRQNKLWRVMSSLLPPYLSWDVFIQ